MERLCLALHHPPLIEENRFWPTHHSEPLLSIFSNNGSMFYPHHHYLSTSCHGDWNAVLVLFTGGATKQQARVHPLIPGICPRAAFGHHRREAVPLPGVSPCVSHQQPCQVCGSSLCQTSQTVPSMRGIQDSFTEWKEPPSECWEECLDILETLRVKFAAMKHWLEKTTDTHIRCKVNSQCFSLISNTLEKKEKKHVRLNPTAA